MNDSKRTVTFDLDTMVVKVAEYKDKHSAGEISVEYREWPNMKTSLWLENIEELVPLVDALQEYIDMKHLRKEEQQHEQ